MNSLLLFIPLVICLLAAFAGLVCAILAAVGLKRIQAAQRRQRAQCPPPPLLSGASQRAATSSGFWSLCLKGLLAFGLGSLLLGLLGVWSTKFSISYERKPAAEWSDGRAQELEPLIRRHCVPFMNRGKSIGLAVAVVTPTNATIMTFGRPSLSSGAPTRADTFFEIGSITKTFTGLALAREIEQGMVRLDQPVQELLPPGVQLPEAARGVTLRQLTTHSSGFPRLPANLSHLRGLGMLLFGSDAYAGYTEADLLNAVRTVKLQSKPGTKSCYSNFGMMLLGHLLATKAGSSYEALVKREVCLPLGMNDTTVTFDRTQAPRVAQGYRAVLRCGPFVFALRSDPWFAASHLGGAGALRSTASDMLKYLQANMHPEGQPLAHALRESHQELFREDERTAFGMNWIHTRSERLQQAMIWHNGAAGGFRSFIGFTEDSRVGVMILSNSTGDVDSLAAAFLRDLAKPPPSQDHPPNRRVSPPEAALAGLDRS
ncbi:MAG: serine hydrolase domain-containing protein [Verrucomicrobiota bacterium]|jgi:CubicO group peptidase (beta-lactamase class C family)